MIAHPSITLTEPDAERLMLLSRYVTSRVEGEHLLELERKVSQADVCEPEQIPPDTVTMNSRVEVRYEDTGDVMEYTVVFPSRASIPHGRISVIGSLGRALLGARVGDLIEFVSGAGMRRCRITKLLYQPEAAGDYTG